MTELSQNWRDLPNLLSWHLLLSLCAVVTASIVALGIALLVDRRPRWKHLSLAVVGVMQTIPGLALLALMVPLLGGSIGFAPAFAALTVYALLPLLQNTVTGLSGTDPRLVEAARGLGMGERQILFQVRFPLAFPVILAGLRTSTVWTVGTTTLATAVGASGLGTYIFTGLQTRNHATTLFGCFFAAMLAIVLDQALRVIENAVRSRRRAVAGAAGAALALALMAATAGALWPRASANVEARRDTAPVEAEAAQDSAYPLVGQHFTVGSKSFVENLILGELVGMQLEASGATVEDRPSMGSTILFDALRQNAVDCYVDYSGTVWATLMKRDEPASRMRTRIESTGFLLQEHGVVSVGALGFENNYAIVMRGEHARRLGIRTIADLSGRDFDIAGDPEVFGRPEWERVRDIYGLQSLATRPMQTIYTWDALHESQVDASIAYTTDGRIAEGDLVILDDNRQAFPPYDAILLVSPEASQNRALIEVLSGLVNRIDDSTMRVANRLVEIDRESPQRAARWLWERTRRKAAEEEPAVP